MSPEEREMLARSITLAEDNNKMLHSVRRSMRVAHTMSILYWIIIIGISVGAYYYAQPYIDQAMKLYGSASSVLKNFKQ